MENRGRARRKGIRPHLERQAKFFACIPNASARSTVDLVATLAKLRIRCAGSTLPAGGPALQDRVFQVTHHCFLVVERTAECHHHVAALISIVLKHPGKIPRDASLSGGDQLVRI